LSPKEVAGKASTKGTLGRGGSKENSGNKTQSDDGGAEKGNLKVCSEYDYPLWERRCKKRFPLIGRGSKNAGPLGLSNGPH